MELEQVTSPPAGQSEYEFWTRTIFVYPKSQDDQHHEEEQCSRDGATHQRQIHRTCSEYIGDTQHIRERYQLGSEIHHRQKRKTDEAAGDQNDTKTHQKE